MNYTLKIALMILGLPILIFVFSIGIMALIVGDLANE